MKEFMKVRKPKSRVGFTLVELLVVIAIMGTLMSMVLPAISSVRESGRKTVCLNNMRQLNLGLETYLTTSKQAYPGYRGNKLKNMIDGPWTVMLFPFIDEVNEYNSRWQLAAGAPNTVPTSFKPILNCVSDPPLGADAGHTSFVYNCGVADTQVDADKAVYHNRANGLGLNRLPSPGGPQGGTTTYNTNVTVEDTKSMTIVFTENIQAGLYSDVDEALIGFVFNRDPAAVTPVENVNGVDGSWQRNNQPAQAKASAYPPVYDPVAIKYARPSSYHPLTVNAAFGGGSLRSLNENLDYKVYQYLMTTDNKRSNNDATVSPPGDDNVNEGQL